MQQLGLIAGDSAEKVGLGGASVSRGYLITSTFILPAVPDFAVLC
jgi:hypothetical protein